MYFVKSEICAYFCHVIDTPQVTPVELKVTSGKLFILVTLVIMLIYVTESEKMTLISNFFILQEARKYEKIPTLSKKILLYHLNILLASQNVLCSEVIHHL